MCGRRAHFATAYRARDSPEPDAPLAKPNLLVLTFTLPYRAALQSAFAKNSRSEGFWKIGPIHLGGGMCLHDQSVTLTLTLPLTLALTFLDSCPSSVCARRLRAFPGQGPHRRPLGSQHLPHWDPSNGLTAARAVAASKVAYPHCA